MSQQAPVRGKIAIVADPEKLISAGECDKMSPSWREQRACRNRTFLCWKRGLPGRNFNPGRFPQGERAQGLISAQRSIVKRQR